MASMFSIRAEGGREGGKDGHNLTLTKLLPVDVVTLAIWLWDGYEDRNVRGAMGLHSCKLLEGIEDLRKLVVTLFSLCQLRLFLLHKPDR